MLKNGAKLKSGSYVWLDDKRINGAVATLKNYLFVRLFYFYVIIKVYVGEPGNYLLRFVGWLLSTRPELWLGWVGNNPSSNFLSGDTGFIWPYSSMAAIIKTLAVNNKTLYLF